MPINQNDSTDMRKCDYIYRTDKYTGTYRGFTAELDDNINVEQGRVALTYQRYSASDKACTNIQGKSVPVFLYPYASRRPKRNKSAILEKERSKLLLKIRK